MIRYTDRRDLPGMMTVFNSICGEPEIFYKELSRERTAELFCGDGNRTVCAYDGDKLIGFASGNADEGRSVGYISYVGVLPEYRRRGIGRKLLDTLEKELLSLDYVRKFETVFYDPTHLAWWIPDGNGADHPCAPGTDKASAMYPLLISAGYFEWTAQNSYFLRLDGYREPDDLAEIREKLLSEGIEIRLYDESTDRDLAGLFDNIGNQSWKVQVMAHTDRPIVVAVDKNAGNLVVSYTGPLSTDPSGRGNFCGIGTRREYRGRGIGKLVFCEMCRRHADRGAAFMTLYTGDTNPARYIYEAAGFGIVRSWGNMRKEVR